MQNKKITMVVMSFISIAAFILAYYVIFGERESKIKNNEFTGGQISGDLGLYDDAIKEHDIRMCEQISDESRKNDCVSTIDKTAPTIEQAIMLSQKGSYLFKEDDYADRSIKYLENFLKSDPKNLDAIYGIGYAHEVKRNYEKALEYYNKALSLSPNSPVIYSRIGHVYDFMEGADKAEFYYKKALEIDSNYLVAKLNLARVYYRREEIDKALVYFEEAYLSPDVNNRTKAEIGYLFSVKSLDSGDLAKASEYASQAIKSDPSFPMAWVAMGQARFEETSKAKSLEEAESILAESLTYFDKAISLNNNQTMAYLNKGRILSAVGRNSEAVDSFKQAKNIIGRDTTMMGDEKKIINGIIDELLSKINKISKVFIFNLIEKAYAGDAQYEHWVNAVREQLPSRPGHNWEIQGNVAVCVPNGATVNFVRYDPPACSPSWGAWGACKCPQGTRSKSDGCGGTQSEACSCDGQCGTASGKLYSATDSFLGSFTSCSAGSSNPVNIQNPSAGGQTSWFCSGVNGGNQSSQCSASRDYYKCGNSLPANTVRCMGSGNEITLQANTAYRIVENCTNDQERCEAKCDDSQGGQCGDRVYEYNNGNCQVCTPNCCEKNTCIGQTCQNGCGTNVPGEKDCREENWIEKNPN